LGRMEHYATLARQLDAGTLAKAAARRAYRRARQALYRPGVSEQLVLKALGVRRRDGLAAKVLDGRAGQVWCEPSQRTSVLAAVKAVPGAVDRARVRAEAAAVRAFNVFGVPLCFGEDRRTDWALDALSGQRFTVPSPAGLPVLPGADPKAAWVLGRLDQLIALGQGYWIAQDSGEKARYSRVFVEETADFIQCNPVGVGVQWACPMEVALRGANLAQALVLFSDAPQTREPDFLAAALVSLAEHAHFVEAHLEDQSAVPNNHLVANHVGLLVMGLLFPGLPGASGHVALAAEGLSTQMEAQVHEDGASFEGSTSYHRLSVELFALAYLFARRGGVGLGVEYARRLSRMFDVTATYCSDEGLAPQLGDNDSGRAFPFVSRESLAHGYLLPLGAALLGDATLKREKATFCDEAAWLLGQSGLRRFECLPARFERSSRLFRDAGWAVLRGGGAVLTVSVGRNGQRGMGGHSHNDKLSFELHLHGRPVIVDPGSPAYTCRPEVRNAYRGTSAHNTVELDARELAPLDPRLLFALPEAAGCEVVRFQAGPRVETLAAKHRGYCALSEPWESERSFVFDKAQKALGLTDVLRGQGCHAFTSRLHLPDVEAWIRPATPEEVARVLALPGAPQRLEGRAVVLGPPESPRAVVLFEAHPPGVSGLHLELESGRYSPGYGVERPARVIVLRGHVRGPARIGLVILWG